MDILSAIEEDHGEFRDQPANLTETPTNSPAWVSNPRGSFGKGDIMAGGADKAKGRVKKAVGELTDNKDLKREGEIDQVSGKVKDATQKVADKAREVVHKK